MPVDTKHKDYAAMLPKWQRMRDASAGQDAIHGATELYLPKLTEEEPADYAARLARTGWFNATWRTIEGLRGMLFRKAPTTVISEGVKAMLMDITKSGVDFDSFALKVTEEVLTVGRVGVLADYPSGRTTGMTVAQVEALNLRPNLAMYTAESIINWKTSWRRNRTELTKVVMEESEEVIDPDDEFKTTTEPRWRVLDLHPKTGLYRVRMYRKANGEDELIGGEVYPQMNSKPLDFIPFQFIGTDDTTAKVSLPPLLDLVNVNIGHYQTTADLEHGAHKTALPQPWITGVGQLVNHRTGAPEQLKFYMGGSTVWTLDNPAAQVGMLEYTGAGLASLEKRLEVKERQMAVLGARMLEQQKSGVETAEAAGIHRSGEQSALATIGATVGKALTTVMGWFDQWAGGDGKATVTINDEFFPASLTAQDVTALLAQWQAGGMSSQEHFEKLQKGGWIRDGKEYDEHETEIANAPPALSANTLSLPATAQEAA